MATPILTDLRHHWPETKITVQCQGILSTVIQEDPHIDHLLNFKKPSSWFNSDAVVTPLKEGKYDLGILLPNSFSSAFWFWRGDVKNRIGFADHWRTALLNFPIPFPQKRESQHLVITYKALLESLGIPLSQTAPRLYVTQQEQQSAKELLDQQGTKEGDLIIGINPGAAFGSAKCWLPERFKQLTKELLQFPKVKIAYFGDKAGAPLVEEICSGFSERVINLAGKTNLRELMALIQSCTLFLTNDSGPMHVASALGVPLIALFGSTSDVATGPYNGGVVIHKHVPCSPCYRRECPIDFRCMKRIEVKEVYDHILSLLNNSKANKH